MQHAERLTLAEMREFLGASSTVSFAAAGRKQIRGLVEGVWRTQQYLGLSRKDKMRNCSEERGYCFFFFLLVLEDNSSCRSESFLRSFAVSTGSRSDCALFCHSSSERSQ